MEKSILFVAIAWLACLPFSAAADDVPENVSGVVNREATASMLKDYTLQSFWASPLLNGTQCQRDMKFVLEQAEELNLWALEMLDASAKLPSGILSGNLNQYGDFDECLSVRGRDDNHLIKGKYCLANIDIRVHEMAGNKIRILDDLLHSHRLLTNTLSDHGHRIAKTETFLWGLCVSSSCTTNQVKIILDNLLKEFSKGKPMRFDVFINDELCYVGGQNIFSPIRLLVACLFSVILITAVLDLFVDLNKLATKRQTLATLIKCFSIQRNWNSLMRTNGSEDDIQCLHGARFLKAVALLLSHKQMAMLFTPTFNRTSMSEAFSRTWTMLGRSAILYTDSFIMFSGVLVSYSFVKDLDSKRTINFKNKLFNRIVRFTPNLIGIILFCTYIMDSLSTGPQWGLVVTKYADLCKKNMWKNLLYVHNYFGFENMCLTHTHQLGIDMQLYLVSPIFVYALWKSPKIGWLLLATFSGLSTWLRYEVTLREKLSTLIYYGISVDRLWKTANLSYILPTHRLTVYLVGIALGYYLRRGGKRLQFGKTMIIVCWMLATFIGLYAMFAPYKAAFKGYVYDPLESARYNAFAPILWTFFMGWVLLACVNGYGGIVNTILSWKHFRIFTKISYSIYLTQFPVFFYGVGTERTVQYFKGFQSLFDIPEFCIILMASLALTLFFEMPFQEMKKSFLTKRPVVESKEKVEDTPAESISNATETVKTFKTRRLKIHGI